MVSDILKNENEALYPSKSRTGQQPIGRAADLNSFFKGSTDTAPVRWEKKTEEEKEKRKKENHHQSHLATLLKLVSVHLAHMSRGSRLEPWINFKRVKKINSN